MVVRSTVSGTAENEPGFQVDNINLNPVPEPASMIALGIGTATLAARRHKKA